MDGQTRGVRLAGLDAWLRHRPWVPDVLLALAVALVLAPTSLTLVWTAGWSAADQAVTVAAVGLAHASVAARRWRPVHAYVACCVAMLALVLLPDVPGSADSAGGDAAGLTVSSFPPILLPSALVYLVLLYSVAAYTARPRPALALVTGMVGAVVTTARLWQPGKWAGETGTDPGSRLFVLAALVAAVLAPWALGRFRSVRAAYVEALEDRALRAEQDRLERARQAAAAERARIAREMHDVVAHSLAVIVRQAEGGRFAAARDPAAAAGVLAAVADTGREALHDMRGVLGVLQSEDDTSNAPQPTLDDVPALVARVRASGLPVDLADTGTPVPLDRVASLAAYRVVQEALTNVVKHAVRPESVHVRLGWSATGLEVEVTDSVGSGLGQRTRPLAESGDGYGLVGMRERVTLAGGRLEAGPDDEAGFVVRAHLPSQGRRGLGVEDEGEPT